MLSNRTMLLNYDEDITVLILFSNIISVLAYIYIYIYIYREREREREKEKEKNVERRCVWNYSYIEYM